MEAFPPGRYGLILGVSSGFGAASAIALARRGMNIVGVHLDRAATMPEADKTRKAIETCGVEAHFFNVNAVDPERRLDVISFLKDKLDGTEHGRVSLLLHSLAFGSLRPLIGSSTEQPVTEAQLAMTMNVMASSLVFWAQDLIASGMMRENGTIIALTSSGARRVLPNYGPVSAAKAALESYCRQLAFELGPSGISVNAIEAGVTDTPALRKIPGNETIMRHALERNPRRRLTRAEDVAEVVTMLATLSSNWINGDTIRVDGGEGIVELDWRREET